MITVRHFVERDFKTFRMAWFLLLGFLVVFWGLSENISLHRGPGMEMLLPQLMLTLGLLFATIPSQSIVGTRLRSQTSLSRGYLMSLPIEKRKLYRLILLRFLPYQLPLAAAGLIFMMGTWGMGRRPHSYDVLQMLAHLTVGIFWFSNMVIWMMVDVEKTTLTPFHKDRLVLRFKSLFWSVFDTAVVAVLPFICQFFVNSTAFFVGLLAASAVAAHRFYAARTLFLRWDA